MMSLAPPLVAVPFVAVLLSIALLPTMWPQLWHAPRRRGLWLVTLALPAVAHGLVHTPAALALAAYEYLAFIVLLASMFVTACCVELRGSWRATPMRNASSLAVGAALASCVGTLAASLLLLPPLLRSNAGRRHVAHTIVFFIFTVSNVGGLLLPLGDPPLFLGYLHGVPFFWTLRLWRAWLAMMCALLLVYLACERYLYRRETAATRARLQKSAQGVQVRGRRGIAAIALLVALQASAAKLGLGFWTTQSVVLAITTACYAHTPAARLRYNRFAWQPLVEVVQIFAAIFATMPQALALLAQHHEKLPLNGPTSFFWWTGALSAVLDNAPCYLAFASVAAHHVGLAGAQLHALASDTAGAGYLEAVALGSVAFGAVTYVGNGPNLLVRSLAEGAGVRMPSFFGYLAWAAATLLPVLACTHWLLYTAMRY